MTKEKVETKKSVPKVKTLTKPVKKTTPKLVDQTMRLTNTLTTKEKKLIKQHASLKLQIELVPGSCWWTNVRSNLTQSQWDKIRKPVYANANFLCEICGERGTKHPVECHEVWIYNDKSLIQKLDHFQSLCPLCHEVKHIGLAELLGNYERSFKRFKRINKLDDTLAGQIKSAVFRQWNIRSKQKWILDIEHLREHKLDPAELKKRKRKK